MYVAIGGVPIDITFYQSYAKFVIVKTGIGFHYRSYYQISGSGIGHIVAG
jgi:hypothetical protein